MQLLHILHKQRILRWHESDFVLFSNSVLKASFFPVSNQSYNNNDNNNNNSNNNDDDNNNNNNNNNLEQAVPHSVSSSTFPGRNARS